MYSENAWETRWRIMQDGFRGHIPDGILVRVSQVVPGPREVPGAWPVLDRFLVDLSASVPRPTRDMLLR
jgi:hypothetical protein